METSNAVGLGWKKQNPLQRKHPSIHPSIHRSSKINRTKTPMSHERPCVNFIDDEKCTRVNHSEIRNPDNTILFTHIRSRRERCESKRVRFLALLDKIDGSRFADSRPRPRPAQTDGRATEPNLQRHTRTRNFRNAKMMQALTSTNLVSAKTVKVAAKKRGLVVMNSSSGPKRVRRDARLLKRERDAKCARG